MITSLTQRIFRQTILHRLSAALMLGILLLLGVLSGYVHPNAEDVLIAQKSRDQGIFYAAAQMLWQYDGRYATNILHGLSPLAFDSYNGFRLVPLGNILFVTLALCFWLNQFFPGIRNPFFIALAFVLTHLAIAPGLPFQITFYAASLIYFLPWGMLFLWTATLIRHLRRPDQPGWFYISAVLLLIANGMSELFLVYNLLAVLLFFVAGLSQPTDRNRWVSLWAMGLLYAASALFFVGSPGISSRLADYAPQTQTLSLVEKLQWASTEATQLYLPRLIENSLLFLPVCLLIALALPGTFRSTEQPIWKALAWGLPIFAVLSTLSYYLTIAVPQANADRIYNTLFFSVQLMAVGLVYRMRAFLPAVKAGQWIIWFGMLLALGLTDNNYNRLIAEYRDGTIPAFDRQMQARIDSLRAVPHHFWHQTDVVAQRREHFWNRSYERYFHLDELRISSDTVGLFKSAP